MVTVETMSRRSIPEASIRGSGRHLHKSDLIAAEFANLREQCAIWETRLNDAQRKAKDGTRALRQYVSEIEDENLALHTQIEEIEAARMQESDIARQAARGQSRTEADNARLQAENQHLQTATQNLAAKLESEKQKIHDVDIGAHKAVQNWSKENSQLKHENAELRRRLEAYECETITPSFPGRNRMKIPLRLYSGNMMLPWIRSISLRLT